MSLTVRYYIEYTDFGHQLEVSIAVIGSRTGKPVLRNGVGVQSAFVNSETPEMMKKRLNDWFQRYIGGA